MNKRRLSLFGMISFSLFVTVWGTVAEGQYCFPVQPIDPGAFSKGGHRYPAVDIFGKRGMSFVAPVSGVIEDISKNDAWNKASDAPDKKGGRWVSLIGDDGFRYYGSHLEGVPDNLCIGQRVTCGAVLGYLGNSGNARGTPVHLHFGISSASTPYGWKTRRGEIEPYHFLKCILRKRCDPQAVLTGTRAENGGLSTN